MSLVGDIAESYRAPGRVALRKLGQGVREDRALAWLMLACFLIFVSEWPGLSRAAHLAPSVTFDQRLGGALMSTLFLLPVIAYALAALAHLVARALGGQGSWYGARLALFWAMLAISPLMLLNGVVAGLVGDGSGPRVLGWIVAAAFLWLWLGGLRATGRASERVGV
ncbi:YIP1 family protein [Acidimangrovimonas sediminis]|uniref:YIP1 family protein n=1 Tax=Acidimangrovimonas sediminis TaxID=2056283 RepID=UPI000C802DDD|nr:YIP1 family protein [Acidimangrovimonas sediminis]